MADDPDTFMAKVDGWVKQTNETQLAIFRESAQSVASQVTENLRTVVNVITGFLRASTTASRTSMPPIDPNGRPVKGEHYTLDGEEIALTIAGAAINDTIYLGVTAAYGPYLEFGTQHIAPRGFIRLAAEQWPQIVRTTVEEVKARSA